jgi:predicted negative regulator of RcsB-dependent stress response
MIQGKTDDALAAVEQLTRDSANDADAWIVKGDIHMIKDQPAEALAAYERALKLLENSGREPIAIMTRQRKAFQRSLEKRGVLTPR